MSASVYLERWRVNILHKCNVSWAMNRTMSGGDSREASQNGTYQERFLAPIPATNTTPTKSTLRSKRPLSPTIYSPAKRRILNEEGIFTPIVKPRGTLSSCASGRAASSYFHQLLQGPDSPVKKLDFGPAKSPSVGSGPVASTATTTSQPSASHNATPKRCLRSPATQTTPGRSNASPRGSSLASSSMQCSMPRTVNDDCFSPRSNVIYSPSSTSIPTIPYALLVRGVTFAEDGEPLRSTSFRWPSDSTGPPFDREAGVEPGGAADFEGVCRVRGATFSFSISFNLFAFSAPRSEPFLWAEAAGAMDRVVGR